jgi:uncharacterized protein (TIGR02266 family)
VAATASASRSADRRWPEIECEALNFIPAGAWLQEMFHQSPEENPRSAAWVRAQRSRACLPVARRRKRVPVWHTALDFDLRRTYCDSGGMADAMTSGVTPGALGEDDGEQPREFPRFEVNAYVDFTGNEVMLFHRIQNISLGGVCIQTAGVEEVGTLVDLVLNFPELDASIGVKGQVAWANREDPMDMGVRFIDLDDERKDTLRKYINLVRKA